MAMPTITLSNSPSSPGDSLQVFAAKTVASFTELSSLIGSANSSISTIQGQIAQGPPSSSANTASALVIRDSAGNFAAGTITASLVGNASSSTRWATARTLSFTGDASGGLSSVGSANVSTNLTLIASGVTAGTYGASGSFPIITVDTKGRVTAVSLSTISYPVTTVAGRSGAVVIASSDITDAASTNVPSTLVKRDINGNLSAGIITAALVGNATTSSALATARTIAIAGDATGSSMFDGSASISTTLTLATTGVTAGAYGAATSVVTFTVDGKGRISAASTIPITFPITTVSGRTGAIILTSADISDATDAGTASRIVKRDASGNFSANLITATLNGTASAAAKLTTARTISGASFDGSANITIGSDGITEGVTNFFFSAARARTALSASGDLAYNPATGVISYTAAGITTATQAALDTKLDKSALATISRLRFSSNDGNLSDNQTTFAVPSGYTPGTVQVFYNGFALVQGNDFTATDGSTVVTTSGVPISAILEIISQKASGVANAAPLVHTHPFGNITGWSGLTNAANDAAAAAAGVGLWQLYRNGSILMVRTA